MKDDDESDSACEYSSDEDDYNPNYDIRNRTNVEVEFDFLIDSEQKKCDLSCCGDDCEWIFDRSLDHRVLLPICEEHRRATGHADVEGDLYLVMWHGLTPTLATWEHETYYFSKLSESDEGRDVQELFIDVDWESEPELKPRKQRPRSQYETKSNYSSSSTT